MSDIGKDIISGLHEALDYAKGHAIGKTHEVTVPDDVDVADIRARQGLSQIQFSRRYRVPLATLRNWEQGLRKPGLAARILLCVIDREPDAVIRSLTPADPVSAEG